MKQFILLNAGNDLIGKKALIAVDNILFIADQDKGSAVCLKSGDTLTVRETAEEVFSAMAS